MTEELSFKPIDEIPEHSARRGPRNSECLRAYLKTKEAPHRKLQVTANPERIDKFYKSMVQWKNRHKEAPLSVRKDGDTVYLWIDEPQANPSKSKR